MVGLQLIKKLADSEEIIVPTLFKPVQFNIIKKLNTGKKLTENEKRYLRGNIREKLIALEGLRGKEEINNSSSMFLNNIGSYYITGLEALKHNGYGWYFETKLIEVINTRVKGNVRIDNNNFKFIRIKSIAGSEYLIDKELGLKYATNAQIFIDAKFTKNEYAKTVWIQMLSRYGKLFVKNCSKFKQYKLEEKSINYKNFGV